MAKFSRHIKQEALRSIILQDTPCEMRMGEIRELVGLPKVSEGNSEGLVAGDVPGAVVADVVEGEGGSLHEDAIKRILDGLTGRELSTGRTLLDEIEKSDNLKWDDNSLEMVLNGENVSFSNMNLLVSKLVQKNSPSIPLALVSFINALLINRIPLSYFRDGDSQNIRQALINIGRQSGSSNVEGAVESERSRKRGREEEEGEETGGERGEDVVDDITEEQLRKKQKLADLSENKKEEIGEVRRSKRLRLKGNLRDSWRELGT